MFNLIKLYGRIILTLSLAIFISFLISQFFIASNSFLLYLSIIPSFLVILIIGFIFFTLIQKSKFAGIINKKSINKICFALFILITIGTLIFRFFIITPGEIKRWWKCDGNKNFSLCKEIEEIKEINGMRFKYDDTYARKTGAFTEASHYRIEFHWSYNPLSKRITIRDFEDQTLTLKVDINKLEDPYYTMTTYYVDSSSGFPFDGKLLDGVIWTSSRR